MKISKSLLSAIAAGIVMSAATSCDRTETIERTDQHENCPAECTEDHRGDAEDKGDHTWDCPACGMG